MQKNIGKHSTSIPFFFYVYLTLLHFDHNTDHNRDTIEGTCDAGRYFL